VKRKALPKAVAVLFWILTSCEENLQNFAGVWEVAERDAARMILQAISMSFVGSSFQILFWLLASRGFYGYQVV